ncbi:hypothetical protein HRV97_14305 [Sphingomonas sp. HHU CXW]|uniref:DUF2946 domain-containing protein n=1 Tax=Sphingomonas hominis TaxID=2741495 RepID=A0ABX2JPE0_9SPHN|nr:hypothetical protein [Sphingomonas hominis]
MAPIRTLLAQRRFAVLICAAALLLKLLVPTGYMIQSSHGHLTITVCSGSVPATAATEMPGMDRSMLDHGKDHGKNDHGKQDHGKAEMPCAFSGLSAAALGAVDPIQLAILIAFVTAGGLFVVASPVQSNATWLRPPLRGPPIHF